MAKICCVVVLILLSSPQLDQVKSPLAHENHEPAENFQEVLFSSYVHEQMVWSDWCVLHLRHTGKNLLSLYTYESVRVCQLKSCYGGLQFLSSFSSRSGRMFCWYQS
ncbi:hypothetical protein AVEN_115985-1 [Araneus ventricosus]|uniref:Uncharacterized protein n=1 Tax=Araneus ventricosus TaxID=182803 RepID=A0A4Y2RYT5_ARAVE|nr:hypothetical protein AVEN_115985-1 [Araneus ventricosus]